MGMFLTGAFDMKLAWFWGSSYTAQARALMFPQGLSWKRTQKTHRKFPASEYRLEDGAVALVSSLTSRVASFMVLLTLTCHFCVLV